MRRVQLLQDVQRPSCDLLPTPVALQQYQDAVQAEGDQDLSRLHRMGVSLENQTSDESEDDCDPSVTDSPVGMFCQIFADVDESKDDLDLSERPDLSTLQVLSHVEQKTTDYQEESSDDGGEDIQHDKDRTDNETMEKRPSKERPVHPLSSLELQDLSPHSGVTLKTISLLGT
ncbi:hypothetical protein MHYP_G00130980 [Metynnis hypsauchen]